MPDNRFFYSQALCERELVHVVEQELHHIQHVMRVKVGEEVEFINGKGQLAQANLERYEKQKAVFSIQAVKNFSKEKNKLILAQAMPRFARLEYILEKATELGVTDIWLFPCEGSEKKDLTPSQLERIRQILISSIKQCGRYFIPQIEFKPSLDKWQPLDFFGLYGDTDPKQEPILHVLKSNNFEDCLWMVGPEKGFNEKETLLLKNTVNLFPVKLHSNILRTDTAAIAGLSIIYSYLISKNN